MHAPDSFDVEQFDLGNYQGTGIQMVLRIPAVAVLPIASRAIVLNPAISNVLTVPE